MIFNKVAARHRSGGTLLITAPANVTVTVSKGDDTKTKIADENGEAFFYGLDAGAWEVTITDGEEIETKLIQITTDFECILSFFNATISVTYPSGSICTCTNGDTVLTAPDTTGNATFAIHEAGEWTVNCNNGLSGDTYKQTSKTFTIIENGQTESVVLTYRRYIIKDGIAQLEPSKTMSASITSANGIYTITQTANTNIYVAFLIESLSPGDTVTVAVTDGRIWFDDQWEHAIMIKDSVSSASFISRVRFEANNGATSGLNYVLPKTYSIPVESAISNGYVFLWFEGTAAGGNFLNVSDLYIT